MGMHGTYWKIIIGGGKTCVFRWFVAEDAEGYDILRLYEHDTGNSMKEI